MLTHSIRWRLQFWLGFLLVCLLAAFGVVTWQLQRQNQLNRVDEELERRLTPLSSAVRQSFRPEPGNPFPMGPPPGFGDGQRPPPPPDWFDKDRDRNLGRNREERFQKFLEMGPRMSPRELRLTPTVLALFDETQENGYYYKVWTRGGSLLGQSTNAPAGSEIPSRTRGDTRTHSRMREGVREAYHFTEMGDCILTGHPMKAEIAALRSFLGWLIGAGLGVLALGLGGGWWLTTKAIRPVEDISAAAARISAGNLSERITTTEKENELGRLAEVLNSTFARLEAAFDQQRQFTADASHELRTPLAVIISEAQTTLARERSAAEYRETVEACLEAAQQMRRLTESLLELARFDSRATGETTATVDMAREVSQCADRLTPLARQHGVCIVCQLQPALAQCPPERFAQVITNLLANAIHYNHPSGSVTLRTSVQNGMAVLTVLDTGQGIAAEDLPHVFKRFYRADKSRSRADGHHGLGLAICKVIVEACGGGIDVTSEHGAGSTFTVKIPEAAP